MMIARLQIATKRQKHYDNDPETPYDGEDMNNSYDKERNYNKDAPKTPYVMKI